MVRAMTIAWPTSRLASAARPAPSARATAEATPPPMPPADIVCMSMTSGKVTETPAKASAPSQPTKYASSTLMATWATSMTTLGAASAKSVGAMGPSSSRRVRASMALESHAHRLSIQNLTTNYIVTSSCIKRRVDWAHAQALRSGVPGRKVARAGGRSLDPSFDPGPSPGPTPVPGLPGEPVRYSAQHPLRSPEAHGGARAGDAPLLLRASAAGRVCPGRQGTRAPDGGGGTRRMGLATRPPADGPRARRVRASGGGRVRLPPLRRAREGCGGRAPANGEGTGREAPLALADPLGQRL